MKKKTLLLSITALIMVTALAVGGTLAYFTDTDKADNTFTVGNVDIDLFEHVVTPSTDANGQTTWTIRDGATTTDFNTYTNVYPGAVLPKDPKVTNYGKNPAYVRMKVSIPFASVWGIDSTNYSTYLSDIFGTIDSNWELDTARTGLNNSTGHFVYVFKYNTILKSNETTTALFQSVTIPTSFTNESIKNILTIDSNSDTKPDQSAIYVTAEAIQSESFTTNDAAYTALDS